MDSGALDEGHSPAMCTAGKCSHASPRGLPCRCTTCDAETRAIVEAGRLHAAMNRVERLSEIRPRFRERTFATFAVDESNAAAYQEAQRVALDPKRGLGLHGPFGTGKSHLGAAIVNECMSRGTPARFVSVDDMLGAIRATFDDPRHEQSENALINGYASVPVLVLDDLGKESVSEWAVRTMFTLINRRYEQMLPLIVTTNHAPAQLVTRQLSNDADRVTYLSTQDRIKEMVGTWVAVTGRSHRRLHAQ